MKINQQKFAQTKLQKAVFWGIMAAIFTPIILFPPNFQPTDWTKTILFRLAVSAIIIYFLHGFLYKKNISLSLPDKNNPVLLPFFLLSGLLIWIFITSIFLSQDAKFSFFGSPHRAGGVLNLLFYFVFSAILAFLATKNEWKKIFKALFIVGAIASLVAFSQFFNFPSNLFISYESGGTPSLLGNSTFLAMFMIFLVFLSLAFIIKENARNKKILYGILFAIFIFTVFITGSRASYFALLAGFVFYFLFYPVKLKKLKIAALGIVLTAALIVLAFNFIPQISKQNHIFSIISNRLSISKLTTDLVSTRGSAWKIAWEAAKDKPFFGWGWENFYIGFEKYYDPKMPTLQRLWWDRPHNGFLEVLVNSGFPALLMYIAFWAVLLWQLQIFKRKKGDVEETYLAHATQAMFITYLIVLFFNFDSFASYLISFLFIGFSFYLIGQNGEKKEINAKTDFFQKKPVLITLGAAVVLFAFFWHLKPFYLNETLMYANNLSSVKKCKQALAVADKKDWSKSGIIRSYASLRYADLAKRCSAAYPDKEIEYAKKVLSYMDKATHDQPKYTRSWITMGSFVNVLAAREEDRQKVSELLEKAEQYFRNAIELSPKRQETYVEMEKSRLISKDFESMKEIAHQCMSIDPAQGICYWYLGLSEIFLGDQINGKKHIAESKEKGGFTPAYIQLGAAFISQNNYVDAADAYWRVTMDYPENASYHAVMAFLFKQIGKYDEAANEALKVFILQPNNSETESFLAQLLDIKPNSPLIHMALGQVYAEIGKKEKSIQEYNIAKQIYYSMAQKDPNNADHHVNLAHAYKGMQDYENAYKEAILGFKLQPLYKEKTETFIKLLPVDYWQKYIEEF